MFTEVWNEAVAEQREAAINQDGEFREILEGWGVTISDASVEEAEAIRQQMMAKQEEVIKKYKIDPEVVSMAQAYVK